MNKIEAIKSEKDGLDILRDIPAFSRDGWESIPMPDRDRLKWAGVFFRRQTPGRFMMRVRITNGISNSDQFRALASICEDYGNGNSSNGGDGGNGAGQPFADLTTRQQVQLRDFSIADVPDIWARLDAVGLVSLQTGMDNIRTVVGCPAAGLTPHELLDASPVAARFTAMFLGNREFTNLPRKFNVTITGCRANCTHAATQDIALTPALAEIDGAPVAGFNVAVGGKMGSGGYAPAVPLDIFVPPDDAAELCRQIALLFRDCGARAARNKTRLAFLLAEWGPARFRAALAARLATSPETSLGHPTYAGGDVDVDNRPETSPGHPTYAGGDVDVDNRPETSLGHPIYAGGDVDVDNRPETSLGHPLQRAGADARTDAHTDHIGIHPQRQPGLSYAGLCVPVGRITAGQLRGVADLADRYGSGAVRITPGQNLLIPNIPNARLAALTAEPLLRELPWQPSPVARGTVSCTGIDYCHFALIETKARAAETARALENRLRLPNPNGNGPSNGNGHAASNGAGNGDGAGNAVGNGNSNGAGNGTDHAAGNGAGDSRPVSIYWSGCANGCANHTLADIGLVGRRIRKDGAILEAVDIYRKDRRNAANNAGDSNGPPPAPAMTGVLCSELPAVLEQMLSQASADAGVLST